MEQAQADAASVVNNRKIHSELFDNLQKSTAELASIKTEISIYKAREKELAEGELRVKIFEQNLVCARENVAFAREIVSMIFGNNKYKYTESGSVPLVLPYSTGTQYGGPASQSSGIFSKTVEGEE